MFFPTHAALIPRREDRFMGRDGLVRFLGETVLCVSAHRPHLALHAYRSADWLEGAAEGGG